MTNDAHVAHHFEDAVQQQESATLGMWLFLITEVMFIGAAFGGYSIYRYHYPEAFEAASRALDMWLGAANTAVLLTSSLTMALAVWAAHRNSRGGMVFFLVLTIIFALAFLGAKTYEYLHKWEENLIPGLSFDTARFPGPESELFFSFYFVLTGLHGLHVLIGVGILAWVAWGAAKGRYSSAYFNPIEVTGLYWHFVDIVWIFLFPLLYLIDRT